MKVLSIDAWGNEGDNDSIQWDWNAWYNVGEIDKETFESLKTDAEFIQWFIDNGYIIGTYANRVYIEDDDQHNIVICNKETSEPLFAIEYGNCY